MLKADETAKIFVQVYGLDEDNSGEYIFANTLIIFSILPLLEIQRIFNVSKDIFPSDIGEKADFSQDFVVDDSGNLLPIINLFNSNYPAALLVTAPHPAPCGAAAPAVPAARYCKHSFGFARLLSLPLSAQDTAG